MSRQVEFWLGKFSDPSMTPRYITCLAKVTFGQTSQGCMQKFCQVGANLGYGQKRGGGGGGGRLM